MFGAAVTANSKLIEQFDIEIGFCPADVNPLLTRNRGVASGGHHGAWTGKPVNERPDARRTGVRTMLAFESSHRHDRQLPNRDHDPLVTDNPRRPQSWCRP